MIDLHAHTTASDGSLSPTGLVDLAAETGLAAVAITDHDTIDGVEEGLEAGRQRGIPVIPGVEVSADYPDGAVHILGYFFRPIGNEIREALGFLQQSRTERNPKIIQKLREHGIDITMEDAAKESGGGQIGRPHIARAVVKKGGAGSVKEVFDRFLARGKPCYMDKERFSSGKCIRLIRDSGGIPSLAHPYQTKIDSEEELKKFIAKLREEGLLGIETFHSGHTSGQVETYQRFARELDLVPTGGTDFHGETKPLVRLGSGIEGNVRVPEAWLERLKEKDKEVFGT